jgi:hypothetical protein
MRSANAKQRRTSTTWLQIQLMSLTNSQQYAQFVLVRMPDDVLSSTNQLEARIWHQVGDLFRGPTRTNVPFTVNKSL